MVGKTSIFRFYYRKYSIELNIFGNYCFATSPRWSPNMKTRFFISFFTLVFCATFAQTTATKTNTSGCGMSYIVAMKSGSSFEQTSYDSKGS